jgi:Fe-S-cluster-containing hydrogenase component 2
MSILFRDGKFDVTLLAGPRVESWPSAGVKALSLLCGDVGLSVGLFGGEDMTVRGVVPLPGTGGVVLVEDVQHRVHRIHSRAIVKVSRSLDLPDPFPGWHSEAVLPLQTARRLLKDSRVQWDPATVVLGTGNEGLRFGSTLLEAGVREVFCVESHFQWGLKRFAGWEVEKRRFEIAGGKILEARPVKLSAKGPLLWELRLQDAQGVRILDVARVVSAGPFRDLPGVREYPPGSFLFELEQTAGAKYQDNVEGWVWEEERGRWLAGKITRALVHDLRDAGADREKLESHYNRARTRLKRYHKHREEPFTPAYEGKWIASADSKRMRSFSGMPQGMQKKKLIAAIECFEEIPCSACQTACPEDAIRTGRIPRELPVLDENKCSGCGICVSACPSSAVSMVQEETEKSMSRIVLPWRGARPWKVGESAVLLNRRGETLGSGRVARLPEGSQVELEVPIHLVWDARGLKFPKSNSAEDETFLATSAELESRPPRVEITFNGERRIVRDKVPVTVALFETGQSRTEDTLFCADGSCGLCQITIDGVKKFACKTEVHRGMAIRKTGDDVPQADDNLICPCLGITRDQIIERMIQGKLQSAEAVLSVLHVGEGKCHGQICMGAFKRLLEYQGLQLDAWIDWRFPWSEWVLTHN